MQQIKLFLGVEHRLDELEQEVNGFLASPPGTILSVSTALAPQTRAPMESSTRIPGAPTERQRPAPSDVLITVVYEEN